MDVSFIGHADGCGMDMEKVSAKKKSCCKDEVHHIEGQDELQQTSVDEFNFSPSCSAMINTLVIDQTPCLQFFN